VPVRPTATISEAGAYRFRKKDPIDVRVSRLGGRVALGFLHELGHLLDHQVFYDRKTRTWASAVHIAFTAWRTAAATLERRPLPGGRGRQRYFSHRTRCGRAVTRRPFSSAPTIRSCK